MTAIREIRESLNISQAEAARRLGLSRQAYSNYELGKRQADYEMLLRISEEFHCSVEELLGRKPEQPNAQRLPADCIRMIPVFESVSAGFGANAENRIVDFIPIFIQNNTEADRTICVRVCGDSMHPQIQDGDLVQVLKQETAETGDIVVILDGENGYVKRYIHSKNGVILESFNPNYPPMRYTREESNELRIVGIVKRVIRDL